MTLQDHINPIKHPLPLFLDDWRPLISDDPELKACLIDADQQETLLGMGARLAWGFIDPIDRNLMLFSWAVRQDSRQERNNIAQLNPSKVDALNVLHHDIPQASPLFNRALSLISQDTKHFGETSVFFHQCQS